MSTTSDDWPQAREWMILELGFFNALKVATTAAAMAGVTGNEFRKAMAQIHKVLNPRPAYLNRGDWVDELIWSEAKRLEKHDIR